MHKFVLKSGLTVGIFDISTFNGFMLFFASSNGDLSSGT